MNPRRNKNKRRSMDGDNDDNGDENYDNAMPQQMMTKRRMEQRQELLKLKLENFQKGEGVLILLHITHTGGTFIRTKLAKANSAHITNPPNVPYSKLPPGGSYQGPNRTNFFKMLLPSHYAKNGTIIHHNNTTTTVLPTNWNIFYDGSLGDDVHYNFFIWWELSGNKAGWSYHPFEPYQDPPLSFLDWESPHVLSVIVMRNPLDRLLSGDRGNVAKQYGKVSDRTTMQWWDFAHDDRYTNNYSLKSLTTPYDDISRIGLQSAKSLLKRLDYILDQDCLNDNLGKVCQDIGLTDNDILSQPSSTRSTHATAQERIHNDTVYKFLTDKNKLDIELYEWSKNQSYVRCSSSSSSSSSPSGNDTNTEATTTTTTKTTGKPNSTTIMGKMNTTASTNDAPSSNEMIFGILVLITIMIIPITMPSWTYKWKKRTDAIFSSSIDYSADQQDGDKQDVAVTTTTEMVPLVSPTN